VSLSRPRPRRGRTVLVALLRGINVGTSKRVAMAALRALVQELGYGEVRTLLNSGNVVFSAKTVEPREASLRIAQALEKKLHVSARVTVISAQELADAVASNPLARIAVNPSRLLVGVLGDPSDREALARIATRDWGEERIALGAGQAVSMWMPGGVTRSKLNAAVSRELRERVTSRNWATVLKLMEMTREAAPAASGSTPPASRR
jgi:uncharacterized protein (DUF1697 family)